MWVSVAPLPAWSRAATVKSWSPMVSVGTGSPAGTVPSQVATPEPPSSSSHAYAAGTSVCRSMAAPALGESMLIPGGVTSTTV